MQLPPPPQVEYIVCPLLQVYSVTPSMDALHAPFPPKAALVYHIYW